MSANLSFLPRPWLRSAWRGLALAALLVVTTSVGGCTSFDASRISVNVDPDQFTSMGW